VRARLRGEEPPGIGSRLFGAVRGVPETAAELRDLLRAPPRPVDAVVVGYAETATSHGHSVADAVGHAYYLHSTRRPVSGFAANGAFAEEPSHSPSHPLPPADPPAPDSAAPAVLVAGELSTARTVLKTIESLRADRPRSRYA